LKHAGIAVVNMKDCNKMAAAMQQGSFFLMVYVPVFEYSFIPSSSIRIKP